VVKDVQAAVLVLVASAEVRLARIDPLPSADEIARFLRSGPENELIRALSHATSHRVLGFGFVSLFVGAVFATEATLLASHVWWSTYFTIVLTALGIPLEIFEILRRPVSVRRYLVLLVNVVILLYLWRRRNEFRDRRKMAS